MTCRRPGSTACSLGAQVKPLCGHARVPCAGAGGSAGPFQPVKRAGAKPTGAGPALRTSVCLHQPVAQPAEDSVLGWLGALGVRQAFGKGALLLADGFRAERDVAHRAVERLVDGTGSAGKGGRVSALRGAETILITLYFPLNILGARASEKTI